MSVVTIFNFMITHLTCGAVECNSHVTSLWHISFSVIRKREQEEVGLKISPYGHSKKKKNDLTCNFSISWDFSPLGEYVIGVTKIGPMVRAEELSIW